MVRVSQSRQFKAGDKMWHRSDENGNIFLNIPEDTAGKPEEPVKHLPALPKPPRPKKRRSKFKRPPISQEAAQDITKGYLKLSQPRESKKKSEKIRKNKKAVKTPAECDTTDTDTDDDVIKGVISLIGSQGTDATKKEVPFRTAKKAAALFGLPSLDSDENDESTNSDDDDDEFDVEKECADMMKESRSIRRSLKKNRSRVSLDDDKAVAPEDTPTSSQSSASLQTSKRVQTVVDQSEVTDESRHNDVETTSSKDKSIGMLCEGSLSQNDKKSGKIKTKRTTSNKLLTVPTAEESMKYKLEPNDMVALKPDGKCLDRPLVGKVVTTTEDYVNIVRYTGQYTGKWHEWDSTPDKKNEGDKVSRDRVLMDGFQLKASKQLPVKVAKHLKQLYTIIDNE